MKRILYTIRKIIYVRRRKQYERYISSQKSEDKFLIVMNDGIGNAVEATPLVQATRAMFPRSEITIYPPPGDLFDDWCVVDYIATSSETLKDKYFTHTFVTWSSKIAKCGNSCDFGKVHQAQKLFGAEFLKPEREYNLDILKRMGYKGPTPPLYVSLLRPKEFIPEDRFLICFVPGGKLRYMWRHKRWPYYEQLAEYMLQEYPNSQLLVIGGKDDYVTSGLLRSSQVVDLRGCLSLRETAWVLRNASIAVGNDCGPMHLADAVQTPSVIIFGPTCELKNGPMYKSIVATNVAICSPCQYNEDINDCDIPICMTELTPDIVLKKINSLLEVFGAISINKKTER